jgi:hypothetical protein
MRMQPDFDFSAGHPIALGSLPSGVNPAGSPTLSAQDGELQAA